MQTAANRPQSGLWPVFAQISASESEEKKSNERKMKGKLLSFAFIISPNLDISMGYGRFK
jgi:hypothetical protein